MKVTPELLARSESYLNFLHDRELDLRGHKIPLVENFGVARDANDSVDLTDNDIRNLANFPLMKRLRTLLLANNLISRIDTRLADALPQLQTLVLTNNAITELAMLDALARFTRLEYISLMGNPVTRKSHYREYVVWRCKSIRVLDFQRVTLKERQYAKSLMESADGKRSELALSISPPKASKTIVQASTNGKTVNSLANVTAATNPLSLTVEERTALEEAIEKSTSLEEIKHLEDRLRAGLPL